MALYLDCFPPQNEERLGSLSKKTCELVDKDVLNLICLLDSYADPYAVDAGFYKNLLILIASNCEWVQQDFGRALCLNFRNVMSF